MWYVIANLQEKATPDLYNNNVYIHNTYYTTVKMFSKRGTYRNS